MSETFSYKNYSIVASLNERSIYLKVIDTVNFLSYEGNVDLKELRVSIDLEGAYKIIINCFKEESNFAVTISVNSGVLKLAFNALIGGFLKMNFEVLLREKIMSNDGQLTLNFNKLEQQQAMAIKSLTEKCNNLEASVNKMQQIIDCCQIFMSNIYSPSGHWCDIQSTSNTTHLNNISSKEITMQDHGQTIWKNISVFYQLEKFTITNFNAGNNMTNLAKFGNTNLKELTLNCCAHASFTSLTGIENFPNLEILTITSAPGLRDVVKVLTGTKHRIKTLKFLACAAVNVVELQTYCQVNNVFLALS
jgi:hypothetical protein